MTEYNRLINETSSYLRSHAHQQVHWYPWCAEAFEKAREENKLVFISIGFSACHWCHEMSRNCFDNGEIATVLNRHYVCIMVDREERPDVDLFYMNIIEILTNSGGWPISCFTLPDGLPVYGGISFSPEQFLEVIINLIQTYKDEREKLTEVGHEFISIVKSTNLVEKKRIEKTSLSDAKLIIEPWRRKFDKVNGGTVGSPKFPLPLSLIFLQYSGYYLNDSLLTEHVELTLDNIALGGIYDHLGGGFFRYAEDTGWKKPHFEKMLYDNAMLSIAYCYAYRNNPKPLYKQIIEEIVDFLKQTFFDGKLFYGSVDAEADNIEGSYYLWKSNELKKVLGNDYRFAADYFGIAETENNILCVNMSTENLAKKYRISEAVCREKIDMIKKRLLEIRRKRSKPAVDTKRIAGWNSLVLGAFCEVYRALGNESVLEESVQLADNIAATFIGDDYSIRRIPENSSPACLDDYTMTMNAFMRLYRITGMKKHIETVRGIIDYTMKHFYDVKSGMFFFSEQPIMPKIPRMLDFIDRTFPSSNSLIARVLTMMSFLENNKTYSDIAIQMINNIKNQMSGAGPYVAYWSQLMYYHIFKPSVFFLPMEKLNKLNQLFIPNILIFPENHDVCKPYIQNVTVDEIERIGEDVSLLLEFARNDIDVQLGKSVI